jgi:hypothetical protein
MQESAGHRQFAVLVDLRPGPNKGLILQHPLFNKLHEDDKLPDRLPAYRLTDVPEDGEPRENYVDPLGKHPQGQEYDRRWLAQAVPVSMREGNTGWEVIVQESYDAAIGRTLSRLKNALFSSFLVAGVLIAVLICLLWAWAVRVWGEPRRPLKPATATEGRSP